MLFSRKTLWMITLMLGVGLIAGCSDDDDGPTGSTPTDQFEVVREAVEAYLTSSDGPVVSAQALYDNMQDGDDTNDYFVVSARSATDFANGHVPGAINIPWRETADPTLLADLPDLSKASDPIAVYCYTGHTAGVATTILRALGYEAYNMKFGMMSWTTDPAIRVQSAFNEATDAHDFPTETTVNTPGTHTLPTLDVTTSSDTEEIILAAAAAYLDSSDGPVVSAQALYDNMQDGDDTNDYFVISVRGETDYANGHIPGAINIPWREISDLANLAGIPADQPIAVYCYTGHTAAVATTALRMLGYEAYNMKFGMMSWTTDPAIRVQSAFSEATDAHDFPTEL